VRRCRTPRSLVFDFRAPNLVLLLESLTACLRFWPPPEHAGPLAQLDFFLDLFPPMRDLFSRSSVGQWRRCSRSPRRGQIFCRSGIPYQGPVLLSRCESRHWFIFQSSQRSIFPCRYFRSVARRWILAFGAHPVQ
jgi:hypothetical protein